jgi:hypothetical protein
MTDRVSSAAVGAVALELESDEDEAAFEEQVRGVAKPHDDALGRLERLLWEEWDPIGVNNLPGSETEYDSYASELLKKLKRGTTVEKIASHLGKAERVHMGLSESHTKNRAVAERIVKLFGAAGG